MGESVEPRVDFIADYTLKSLRLKPDKWQRMFISDEQRTYVMQFIEKGKFQIVSFCILSNESNVFYNTKKSSLIA